MPKSFEQPKPQKEEEKEEKEIPAVTPTIKQLESLKRKYEGLNESEVEKLRERVEKEALERVGAYVSALEKLRKTSKEGESAYDAELTSQERTAFSRGVSVLSPSLELGVNQKKGESKEDYQKRVQETEKELWQIFIGPTEGAKDGFIVNREQGQIFASDYFVRKRCGEIIEERKAEEKKAE